MASETLTNEAIVREQFQGLLVPIKDMAKNWDIDLTAILEKYADELGSLQIVFGENGNGSNVNFTEAATVIQGTSAVYAKKVEFLYALTQEVMALISNKKKDGGKKGKEKDGDDGGDGNERNEEEDDDADLQNLDNIKESNAINLPTNAEDKHDKYLMKPMPISLIPLEEFEKCDVPLYNRKGVIFGKKDDFRMNTAYVHSTGVLLLDYANADLIPADPDTTLLPKPEEGAVIPRPSPMPGYEANAPSPGLAEGSICEDMDAGGFEAESLELERGACATLSDVPGACPKAEARGSVSLLKTGRQPARSGSRLQIQNASQQKPDPWEVVDPYEEMGTNKPIKIGRTYVLPKTIAKRQERERAKSGDADWELTSVYLKNEFYSLKKRLPKEPWRAVLWPALEEVYYNTLKKEKSQTLQSRLNRKRDGRLRPRPSEEEEKLMIPDDVEKEEEKEEVESVDGNEDADNWEEELARNDDDDYQIARTKDAHESDEESPNTDDMGYEDLVKQSVRKYLKSAQKHMVTTELTKRVQAWEDRIEPALAAEGERRRFDIHEYGTELLTELGAIGGQKSFAELVAGKPKWEIGRYFLSSLVMANTYNVGISDNPTAPLDSMKLEVLSKERHHEQFT